MLNHPSQIISQLTKTVISQKLSAEDCHRTLPMLKYSSKQNADMKKLFQNVVIMKMVGIFH